LKALISRNKIGALLFSETLAEFALQPIAAV